MRSVTSGDRLAQQFGPRAAIEQGWPSLPARSNHAIWVWCEGKTPAASLATSGRLTTNTIGNACRLGRPGISGVVLCRWACFPRGLEQWGDSRTAVLDWALPETSGFAPWTERQIGLPGVFLTGYSLVELELQELYHGEIDFVDKARVWTRGADPPLARDPRGAAPHACPGYARGRASRRVGFLPFNSASDMAIAGHRFDRH
jgi:hypothetical protein